MKKVIFLFFTLLPVIVYAQTEKFKKAYLGNLAIQNDTAYLISENSSNRDINWSTIFELRFNQMQKTVFDSVLTDSVYTYKYYFPTDSALIQKTYAYYNLNGKEVAIHVYVLDSISDKWIFLIKDEYYYDSNGYDSLNVLIEWDTINTVWVNQNKSEYNYDDKGNVLLDAYYIWDMDVNAWRGSSKVENKYDENSRQLERAVYTWDETTNDWRGLSKIEYAYDGDGIRTSDIEYDWNRTTHQWEKDNKHEYEFDEYGHRIMNAQYSWDAEKNAWYGNSKYESEYDENRNQTLFLYYSWDNEMNQWRYQQKSEYTYNESNAISSSSTYFWDAAVSEWYGQWKTESWYNENGQDTGRIEYDWDAEIKEWYPTTKTETTYYYEDLIETQFTYTWNRDSETWEFNEKEENEYDIDNELKIGRIYEWNTTHENWFEIYTYEVKKNSSGKKKESVSYSYLPDSVEVFTKNNLIFGFEYDSTLVQNLTIYCPDQTCLTVDSDYVEGSLAALWNYYSVEAENWADGCQLQLKNNTDLTGSDGFYLYYKIVEPSDGRFIILFQEQNGEQWMVEDIELLSKTNMWKQFSLTFDELELLDNQANPGDSVLNLDAIDSIKLFIYGYLGDEVGGSLLIDDLSTFVIDSQSFRYITSKYESEYDEYDNLIYGATYSYIEWQDTLKLQNQYRYDRTYDNNGNQLSYAEYDWQAYSDTWIGRSKREFAYDDSGNVTMDEQYYWDYTTDDWYGYRKTEDTYDEHGNHTSYAHYYWNESTKNWLPAYKDEWYYDYNDERTKHISYDWEDETEQWEIDYIIYYSRLKYYFDEEDNLILIEQIQWHEVLEEWYAAYKFYFFNSNHQLFPVGNPPELAQNENIKIYPVPADDYITIEKPGNQPLNGQIISSSGTVLKNFKLNGPIQKIETSDLCSGIYLLRLNRGSRFSTYRFMIVDLF